MDAKKLTKSLNEVARFERGEQTLRAVKIIPPSVDVKRIRTELALSQTEFAERFGLSVAAIRNWEQGVREPEAATRLLLALIDRNPRLIERELKKIKAA